MIRKIFDRAEASRDVPVQRSVSQDLLVPIGRGTVLMYLARQAKQQRPPSLDAPFHLTPLMYYPPRNDGDVPHLHYWEK